MKNNITYDEIMDCTLYANRIFALYNTFGNKTFNSQKEARQAIKEYNSEIQSFKEMFGYSIKGYVDTIAECILSCSKRNKGDVTL